MNEDLDLSGDTKTEPTSTSSRKRGRPRKETAPAPELEKNIRDSLNEVADWIDKRKGEERVDPDDLAGIIRNKSSEVAELLTIYAEKSNTVSSMLGRIVGKGGPLSALRAFGPIVRHVLIVGMQARADQEPEQREPEQPGPPYPVS